MKPRELIWLLLAAAAFWFLVITESAHAQSLPPIQTINTNQGIPCNAIGSQGAVSFCKPGFSYGCNASNQNTTFLSTDGNRTSIQFQNTGSVAEVLVFGDTAAGMNGFVVQPGNNYFWSNMQRGNEPGRINTTSLSVISTGNSTCAFMFTD